MSFTKRIYLCSPSFNVECILFSLVRMTLRLSTVNFLCTESSCFARGNQNLAWTPLGVASPFAPGNDNTSLILGIGIFYLVLEKSYMHPPTTLKKLKRALSSSISTRNGSVLFRYRCGLFLCATAGN